MVQPALLWFRNDLRLADNPAVKAAAESGGPVLAFFVHEETEGRRPPGGASKWWLHHSLAALGKDLSARGCQLQILRGDARELVPAIAAAASADKIFWTRRYGEAEIAVDTAVKSQLKSAGVEAQSFNGQLLVEPWTLATKSGSPFRVFTPFWREARKRIHVEGLPTAPRALKGHPWPNQAPAPTELSQLELLPTKPDWAGGLCEIWTPGEAGASKRLRTFIESALGDYADGRDFADRVSTSLLSPHLRFGEISPRQIWLAVQHARDSGAADARNADKFLAELGWREFSYQLLYYNRELATRNFNVRFDAFAWGMANPAHIRAWQKGRTGYPIVDAGMRELWRTGYMHNRVRMICASFLVKHLMTDWRVGEQWFWDTLCDADPANNPASWQWVAGSGADAAPYFRIFNPLAQGEKFDPQGDYVRRFIPELAGLDAKYVHKPWAAPAEVLLAAGVKLGAAYPLPIVDHQFARERALKAFAAIKT